ncbi:MAG: DNA-binding protein [Gammaproteobacteria bacterium]
MPLLALTLAEAADAAAIPRIALEALILVGKGPKTRRVGRRNIILRQDLEDWLAELPATNLTEPEDLNRGASV